MLPNNKSDEQLLSGSEHIPIRKKKDLSHYTYLLTYLIKSYFLPPVGTWYWLLYQLFLVKILQ